MAGGEVAQVKIVRDRVLPAGDRGGLIRDGHGDAGHQQGVDEVTHGSRLAATDRGGVGEQQGFRVRQHIERQLGEVGVEPELMGQVPIAGGNTAGHHVTEAGRRQGRGRIGDETEIDEDNVGTP